MNPNVVTRELLSHPGLWDLLRERGVLLDEWDLRLTLAELCAEYGLDLRGLLKALEAAEG